MPPTIRDDAHDLLALHRDVATMLVEVRNMREDVSELKDTLKEELPSLRARISELELERERLRAIREAVPSHATRIEELERYKDRMATRISTIAAIASALGATVLFVVEKVFFK